MAVATHFSSSSLQKNSQDYPFIMSSPTNLSPFPSQLLDFAHVFPQTTTTQPFQQQQTQQQSFVQSMGIGMEIGYGKCQEALSFSFPSNSCTVTNNGNGNGNSGMNPLALSQSITALLDKHRREVDTYLHVQGERLKEALQQQKRQQMALLLNNYQSRTVALLREKEEELEKLRAKSNMLEEILKKKAEESEIWQRVAREKEQMVIELNNTLLLIKQNLTYSVPQQINNNDINDDNNNDAESVCDCGSMNNINVATREENKGNHEHNNNKSACKWCNCNDVSIVFLPCKHLCCCKECEPLLQFCPLCQSLKQGCLEVFLS